MAKTCCEQCAYFEYDEEYDDYYCAVNLDEDELYRFMSESNDKCSFFKFYDEYKMVQKQNQTLVKVNLIKCI